MIDGSGDLEQPERKQYCSHCGEVLVRKNLRRNQIRFDRHTGAEKFVYDYMCPKNTWNPLTWLHQGGTVE